MRGLNTHDNNLVTHMTLCKHKSKKVKYQNVYADNKLFALQDQNKQSYSKAIAHVRKLDTSI